MIPRGYFKEIPTADTIFGAIANMVVEIFGNEGLEDLIRTFRESDAALSSAFPYDDRTFYFPKPLGIELWSLHLSSKEDYEYFKALKKAKYLSLKDFKKAINNEKFEIPEELPIKEFDVPRVALDRVTKASTIFYEKRIAFHNGGLYFLYKGPKEAFEEYIKPAVRLLGDTGIGGNSTQGLGIFEPEFTEISINAPESEYAVTLSNAVVDRENLVLWDLFIKGGWTKTKRKPKITFIREGSIVRFQDPGELIEMDLGIGYSIYVHAKTFPVPILIPKEVD